MGACRDAAEPAAHPAIIGFPDFNPDHFGIAATYAPVFFQSTGDVADFLTRFTYDGDWIGGNNWDDLYYYPLKGYVYWALEETQHYYFIFYFTFHPRDWCGDPDPFPWPFSELWPFSEVECWPPEGYHENDMEGVVMDVNKFETSPAFPLGRVVLAETRFHTQIRSYPNTTNLCRNNIFGQLSTEAVTARRRGLESVCLGWTDLYEGIPRPSFYIEHQGHGVLSTTDGDALAA
jgi:hypothetical protein